MSDMNRLMEIREELLQLANRAEVNIIFNEMMYNEYKKAWDNGDMANAYKWGDKILLFGQEVLSVRDDIERLRAEMREIIADLQSREKYSPYNE